MALGPAMIVMLLGGFVPQLVAGGFFGEVEKWKT